MLGFQECCDAITYSDLGQICLTRGYDACSLEYWPLGSLVLNALLHPYGLAPLSHALLLFFSFYMLALGPQHVCSGKKLNLSNSLFFSNNKNSLLIFKKFIIKLIGAFFLLEFMFMGLASVNLTDVPGGVLAALAIIGFYRKNAVLFALSAGVSILIRAAYLYPMLVLVIIFIFESLYLKNYKNIAYLASFFLCLVPQYILTYRHLGEFSFLDPVKVEYWRNFHFGSNYAGYDTLLPAAGHPWTSGLPFGLAAMFEQQLWSDLLRLFLSRIDFYFSSFVPLGKVYLSTASERIFSPVILLLHFAAGVCSYLYLKAKDGGWRVWIPLLIILAQSLVIIPEQRFIFLIQLFLAIFTYLYFLRSIEATTD